MSQFYERCSNICVVRGKFWPPGLVICESDTEIGFYCCSDRARTVTEKIFSIKKDVGNCTISDYDSDSKEVLKFQWIHDDEEIRNTLIKHNIPDLRLPLIDFFTAGKYFSRNSKNPYKCGPGPSFFFFPRYHFDIFSAFELYADYYYFNICLKRIEKIHSSDDKFCDDKFYREIMSEFKNVLIAAHWKANTYNDDTPIYHFNHKEKEGIFKRTIDSWLGYYLSKNKHISGFKCKNYRFGSSWRKEE